MISKQMIKDAKKTNQNIDLAIIDFIKKELGVENLKLNDSLLGFSEDKLSFLVDKINKNLSINLTLSDIKGNPRIANAAKFIKNLYFKKRAVGTQKIKPAVKSKYYPLSYAQKRLWFLYKLEPNSPLYNIYFAQEITGRLNIEFLKKAIKLLIERHDIFRFNFLEENDEPVHTIADKINIDTVFNFVDLTGIENDALRKEREENIIKEQLNAPFRLDIDHALRITVIKRSDFKSKPEKNQFAFITIIHHIIFDLWSVGIFNRELSDIYNSFSGKRAPDPVSPSVQYEDYTAWEQSPENNRIIKKQEKYWLKVLKGSLPILKLPTDKPRPSVQTYHGALEYIFLGREDIQKLRDFSRQTDTTLFTILLSVYYVFLNRITGQTDIIIGTPVANRKMREASDIMGLFLNSLSLRSDLSDDPTFVILLEKVKYIVINALDNQEIPFEYLLEKLKPERDAGRSPIWNVMFQYDSQPNRPLNLFGTNTRFRHVHNETAKFDFKIRISETKSGELYLSAEYSTDLFSSLTIKNFLKYYKTLLFEILKNPRQTISSPAICSPEEERQLVFGNNNTKKDYPKKRTLHELFEEQVKKTPDNIALEYKDQKITYGKLNEEANKLAGYLRSLGVKREEVIGLSLDHSIDLIISEIAILKSGGACALINPDFPEERINSILKDARAKIFITSNDKKEIPGQRLKIVNLNSSDVKKNIRRQKNINIKNICQSANLAYLFYTSGSTGEPKGVMLEHKGIVNHLYHRINTFNVTAADRLCANMSSGFIIFPLHTFVPLITGAKLIIFPNSTWTNIYKMFEEANTERISIIEVAVSSLSSYLEYIGKNPEKKLPLTDIRTLFIAGEKLRAQLIQRFLSEYPSINLYSAYGQTECSGMTLCRPVSKNSDNSELEGLPTQNNQAYILDKSMKLLPQGVPGELYISGDGLARGYLNDQERTEKYFLPHPFHHGQRIYRTGDLAKMHFDGNIEILGRIDRQIKIRGQRVEPGEIETSLKKISPIKECAVTLCKDKLTAYYTTSNGRKTDIDAIKFHLRETLPEYMVPAYFVYLEKMPLTPSGKIDQKNLPEPDIDNMVRDKYEAPKTSVEKNLYAIWREALKIDSIGVHDNFFNLGGDSLMIIWVHKKICEIYPDRINIAQLFIYPTIFQLARYIACEIEPTKILPLSPRSIISTEDPITVTGISLKASLSANAVEFWKNLISGQDLIRKIPEGRKRDLDRFFDLKKGKGGQGDLVYQTTGYLEDIDKFDYSYFRLSPKEASLLDPGQRLFLETVYEAIDDAGEAGKLEHTKTGLYLGFADKHFYSQIINETDPGVFIRSTIGSITGLAVGRVSYFLDLMGPSLVTDATCSSSLIAIHQACRAIQRGECDKAIVGGIRLNIFPINKVIIGIESKDGYTRSFDDKAGGTNWSEAVAAVILKPMSQALADKDHIYAVIKGSAVNQDGASAGLTAPNAAAQEEVINSAWQDARIDPRTVSYIEAHGTGTKLGDPIEIGGLTRAFRRYTKDTHFCRIGSVKSNLGHTAEASGLVGLIKTCLALKHKLLPPSIHFHEPSHKIDWENSPLLVNTTLIPWTRTDEKIPLRAGVSSFGLSGTNCHVVLEEFAPKLRSGGIHPATGGKRPASQLLLLSAKTENALESLVQNYLSFLSDPKNRDISFLDICYTSATGRKHHECRLAIIAHDKTELLKKLSFVSISSKMEWSKNQNIGIYYFVRPVIKRGKSEYTTADGQKSQNEEAGKRLVLYSDGKADISSIARLYIHGADPDWNDLYAGLDAQKVSLPPYPFERKRCWVEAPESKRNSGYFHQTVWRKERLDTFVRSNGADESGFTLLFAGSNGRFSGQTFVANGDGSRIITVSPGDSFQRINDRAYVIGHFQRDYDRLISSLEKIRITRVIHAWTAATSADSFVDLVESGDRGVLSLFYLTKAFQKSSRARNTEIELVLLTGNSDSVTGREETINPEAAALIGLGKVVAVENPNLRVRSIDADKKTNLSIILKEIHNPSQAYKTAYRENERYIEELAELDINAFPENKTEIKTGGVYIITGGTGGLGLVVASWLAEKNRVKLVLIARTPVPPRKEWDDIMEKAGAGGSKQSRLIETIKKIERSGSEVMVLAADVSDQEELSRALAAVRKKYGKINGIIHAAGVAGDGFVVRKDERVIKEVLAPKIEGTWLLDRLTRQDRLDFFLNFSSMASILPTHGQGDYAAANAYLDAFVKSGNKAGERSGKTFTVNWPAWNEAGMVLDNHTNTKNSIIYSISNTEAIYIISLLLKKAVNAKQIIVGKLNYRILSSVYSKNRVLPIGLADSIRERINMVHTEAPGGMSPAASNTPSPSSNYRENNYTDIQSKLVGIWQEFLGYEEIDINDNFFEIGGDSLMIIQLRSFIKSQMNIDVPVAELFNNSTIKTLADYLSKQKMINYIPIKKTFEKDKYNLSHAQKRIWVMERIVLDFPLYNIGFISELSVDLNVFILEKTLQGIIDRHEAFRTSFVASEDGEPMQIIRKNVKANLKIIDLTAVDKDMSATLKKEVIERNINAKFDLSRDELLRTILIKIREGKWLFVAVIHHIICDLSSLQTFYKELNVAYNFNLRGQSALLPPLSIQYKDYAEYEQTLEYKIKLKPQEKYWIKKLSGELPILDLPTDKPRLAVQRYDSRVETMKMGAELTRGLNRVANDLGVTTFVLLLSIFKIFLARITGQTDIIVGTFVTGRDRLETENIFGILINTIALRSDLGGEPSFSRLLMAVRKTVLEAMTNKDYPFEYILEKINPVRDLSRAPVFTAVFQLLRKEKKQENYPDTILEIFDNTGGQYDINLRISENDENDNLMVLTYNTSLFNAETAKKFLECIKTLSKSAISDPDKKISELEIVPPAEKQKLLCGLNDSKIIYPKTKTIDQLFEEQVVKNPDYIAIEYEDRRLTYRELNEKVNCLANNLKKKYRIKPDDVIGIMTSRSFEMVIGVLAILKSGGAYLPLDPEQPPVRIKYMLVNARAKSVLTDGKYGIKIRGCNVIDISDQKIYTDHSVVNLKSAAKSLNLAYVIYTSGSTGNPKGVAIEHRSVVNFMTGITKIIDFSPKKKILAATSPSFDISVLEIILPLTKGLSIVLSSDEKRKDPRALISLVKKHKINILQFTPSVLETIIRQPGFDKCLDSVDSLIMGGEILPLSLLTELQKIRKNSRTKTKLYNAYGPTETTVWSAVKDLTRENEVTIGRPIGNTRVYVLDNNSRLLPAGIPGELYIAGYGLARGYINDPEKTREAFRPHPFIRGDKIYATGDIAKIRPDGDIEILGRTDYQVKIRGQRIELEEIEVHIKNIKGISGCVVKERDGALTAYFTAKTSLNISEIKYKIGQELPAIMIPSYFVRLKKLPLTPSGKIDRKSLTGQQEKKAKNKYEAPRGPIEVKMADIWRKILGIKKISRNDNFFDLGGDSLKAIKLLSALRIFEEDLTLNEIFQNKIFMDLAQSIKNKIIKASSIYEKLSNLSHEKKSSRK